MSRAAIYQLLRRIPDADDAAIDAAVDALAAESRAAQGEGLASKADLADIRAEVRLLRWMMGIQTALILGVLWLQLRA